MFIKVLWSCLVRTFCVKLPDLIFVLREINDKEKLMNSFLSLWNSSKYAEDAGYSVGEDTIFTECEHFVKNATSRLSTPIIHFIAQRRVLTYVCSGDRLLQRLTVSMVGNSPFDVQIHYVPENLSLSFYDHSAKQRSPE